MVASVAARPPPCSASPPSIGTGPSCSRNAAIASASSVASLGESSRVNWPVRPVRSQRHTLFGVAWPTMAPTLMGGLGHGRSVLNTNESGLYVESATFECQLSSSRGWRSISPWRAQIPSLG